MQVYPLKALPVANGYFQGAIAALDILNGHNSRKFSVLELICNVSDGIAHSLVEVVLCQLRTLY